MNKTKWVCLLTRKILGTSLDLALRKLSAVGLKKFKQIFSKLSSITKIFLSVFNIFGSNNVSKQNWLIASMRRALQVLLFGCFFFFQVIYKKSQVRMFYIFLFQTRLIPFYQELYFTIQNAQHASTFTFGQQLRVIIASFRRKVILRQTFPRRNILLANETDLMPWM